MPDKEVAEPEIQIEVVPEPDEEKPRLKSGDTSKLDVRDEEIGQYGREVQDRIKKLRFAYHEERRQKEQKERDLLSTTDYAQRLHRENVELKKNVQRSEQAVVHQALTRVDAEIDSARRASKAALDSGESGQIVDSQEKLARAVAEKERLVLLKSEPAEERPDPSPQQPQQPQQPQVDQRTQAWFAKNPWWNKPGEEERTHFARGVDESLRAKGVTAVNNPDLYWKTVETRLIEKFPEHYANGNGNGDHADRDLDEEREEPKPRPLAVAGGTRSNTGAAGNASRPRVIRLSESQVRLARRIGLTPEQYAHQLALEEGASNA